MFIARSSPQREWKEVSEKKVAAFCVKRCGGGYTVSQTRKAMVMLDAIRNGHHYTERNGLEIWTTISKEVSK